MMTLDEAIKHAEEVAEVKERQLVEFSKYRAEITKEGDECLKCAKDHRQLAEWLTELKELREKQKWIPCSEGLPDDGTHVLTTIYIPNRMPRTRSGWYEQGYFLNDNGDTWNDTDPEVAAWMPSPRPYLPEDGFTKWAKCVADDYRKRWKIE